MIKKVLIVEDLPHVLKWQRASVFQAFPEAMIDCVSSLLDAKAILNKHDFDLVLLDIGLPDGSGLDLIPLVLKKNVTSMIVVSTLFDDDVHVFKALRMGAKGYILKDESKAELSDMLKKIEMGHQPISPGVANRLLAYFSPQPEVVRLTPRETEVLTCIAKGLSVPETSDVLKIKSNTCYGYIKDIYQKLNINSRAEAALEATKMGLIQP